MVDIQKRLGNRIRELRKKKGLTISQLAEKTNLSDNFIGSIERGIRSPAIKTLEKIALALEVKVKDLFHFPDVKARLREKALNELILYLRDKKAEDIELISKIAELVFTFLYQKRKK